MHQFSEHHPDLAGFSKYYQDTLLPELIMHENKRKTAFAKLRRDAIIIAMGAAVLIVIVMMTVKNVQLSGFFLMMGFIIAGVDAGHRFAGVKSQTKYLLVSGICEFVGWTFNEGVAEIPDLDILIQNGLLPKHYDRVKYEDEMSGNVHDADFNAIECHMERKVRTKNGHRWVTTFRGALMVIDFHRDFSGKTVVLRDAGFFNPKTKDGMKRVGLADPVFEKLFEAYGTDQVEARYLLTPDFMQRLVDLESSVDGKKIRFGFLNDVLLIAVETPNRFEAGSMMTSLTDTARTQKILNEVAAVYGVVDGLMKPQSVPASFRT